MLSLLLLLDRRDQLFVCNGEVRKGAPLSKQWLSCWIVEVIKLAYRNSNQLIPAGVTYHSTRDVSSSWAALRQVSLAKVVQLLPGLLHVPLHGSTS